MLDTLSVARELTARGHRQRPGRSHHQRGAEARRAGATNVTAAQLKAGVTEVRIQLWTETAGIRTAIADLGTRLILWMVGTVLATAALTFAVLQFLAK